MQGIAMEASFAIRIYALLYTDDLVGTAFTPGGWLTDIIL